MNASWVSSSEVRCVSQPASSYVHAADRLFLEMSSVTEVLETSSLHTSGPRGAATKNGELILTYAETMQERSLVVRGSVLSLGAGSVSSVHCQECERASQM